jgi:hypothetical protein
LLLKGRDWRRNYQRRYRRVGALLRIKYCSSRSSIKYKVL